MLLKFTNLPLLLITVCMSLSLHAMQQTQQRDDLNKTLQGVRNNQEFDESAEQPHSVKTKIKAFKSNLPPETTIRSHYLQKEDKEAKGLLTALVNTELITKTTTVVKGNNTEPSTEYELDVRPLEVFFKKGILAKESKEISDAARKDEQNKLYIFQRHPGKFALLCIGLGASLPYLIPALLEKYKSIEQ